MVLVVPEFLDMSVKADLYAFFRHRLHPDFPTRKPEIGQLRLPAVHQLLAEDAVLIAQGIPRGGVALCGQGVQEAGGKPAQPAVAQPGVRFLLVKTVQLQPQLAQRFAEVPLDPEVEQIVFQRTAQQEFHTKIVNLLGMGFFRLRHIFAPARGHQIAHGERDRFVTLFVGRVFKADAENTVERRQDRFLDFSDRLSVIHNDVLHK